MDILDRVHSSQYAYFKYHNFFKYSMAETLVSIYVTTRNISPNAHCIIFKIYKGDVFNCGYFKKILGTKI